MTKLFENAITAVFKITYYMVGEIKSLECINPEEPILALLPELLSLYFFVLLVTSLSGGTRLFYSHKYRARTADTAVCSLVITGFQPTLMFGI